MVGEIIFERSTGVRLDERFVRMAVVGVGWAGSHHVEGARELGRKVEVTCLVDRDSDHLKDRAEAFGIEKTYTDLDDALMDPEICGFALHTSSQPLSGGNRGR